VGKGARHGADEYEDNRAFAHAVVALQMMDCVGKGATGTRELA
jgi:hypothetical protein